VPKFFFHVRKAGRLVPQYGDGFEFANLDEAEREAGLVALEVARDMLPVGEAGEIRVEVNDDAGHRLVTITVSIDFRRESGAPPPARRRPF
jgi:hypothetical protein